VKSPFLWLALIGLFLVGLAAYLQGTSMDLSRFGVSHYLTADSAIPAWWHGVALPFILGLLYLVTAFVCLCLRPRRRVTFAVLAGCLLLAAALCLFNVGVGLLAFVMLALLLVATFPWATSSQQ